MAREKAVKPPKEPKVKRESSGKGKTVLGIIAILLALASLSTAIYFGMNGRRIAQENSAINAKLDKLEQNVNQEKNRESVLIQMEPHGLEAYMTDSARLYQTLFSSVRYDETDLKLRVPVTVTIHNNSDQTITISDAALYPWETVFEETTRQESLAAEQEKGFFGELTKGERSGFSIAPGKSQSIEIDARLRGVYTHPAMEAELRKFFSEHFKNPEQLVPTAGEDLAVTGKGTSNGRVNYLLRDALGFYCTERSTRFTLTYRVTTARGNAFSSTCSVVF